MAVIPTTLGQPSLPQQGYARPAPGSIRGGDAIAQAGLQNIQETSRGRDKVIAGLNAVADSFDKLQLQADQKEAKDALNGLMNDRNTLLYGDGTPQNPGYLNLNGDAAVKAAPAVKQQLEKLRQGYVAKASNKQVTQILDPASQALIQPNIEDILSHAAKEHGVALDVTDKATVDAATNSLVANPTNQQAREQNLALIQQSTLAMLDRQGITDPLARADAVKNASSDALQAAVRTALVRNPQAGKALYAQLKDGINGTDQAKVEQEILTAENTQRVKEEHAVYMQDYYDRKKAQDTQDGYASQVIAHIADPTKPLPDLNALAGDKSMHTGQKMEILQAIQQAQKPEPSAVQDAKTIAELMPRILAPFGDPKRINDYSEVIARVGAGNLSGTKASFLMSLIDQSKTESGQKLAPSIQAALVAATRFIGRPDINGIFPDDRHALMLQQWTQNMYDKIEQFKKDNKDPRELFDKKSKDYILDPVRLQQYGIPLDSSIQHAQDALSGGTDGDTGNPDTATLPAAPSSQIPVFSDPNDPLLNDDTKFPVGSSFYRADADGKTIMENGVPKVFYKKARSNSASIPVAPSGQ